MKYLNDFLSNDLSPKNYASNLHYLCKPTPFSWHAFFLVYHFMFRALFFLVVLLCTCFLSLAASSAIEPTSVTPQPNILMIYADDLGYETLQCYDGLDFTTPKLDAMAAEGVRFNRAYASPSARPLASAY